MLDSLTMDKLYLLAYGQQRQQLNWLKRHITQPLGDWQCHPNPYAVRKDTLLLLPAITGLVYNVGGPTIEIPVEDVGGSTIPVPISEIDTDTYQVLDTALR